MPVNRQVLPTILGLTRGQRTGTHCVWCRRKLGDDRVQVGVAGGYAGPHDLSATVYACPDRACADRQQSRPPKVRKP